MSILILDRVTKLADRLFTDPVDKERFSCSVISKNSARSLNVQKDGNDHHPLAQIPLEWTTHWSISEGNSYDHGYSLDCSSLFMTSPLLEIKNKLNNTVKVLDTCAAPGGKSYLAYSLLLPNLLVANEKTQSRIKSLISNFSKHKLLNAAIISQNIKNLITTFSNSFDLVLLDAPCSGQSMLARGINNPSSLTKIAIDRASNTQKGLINQAAKLVNPTGYLLYSTCTYSKDENEKVIEWFLRKNPEFSSVNISHLNNFQSQYSEENCYRLWPFQKLGSGGFTCLLKNTLNENIFSQNINLNEIKKFALWQSIN